MKRESRILILGASYGSLLATKLVLAGHRAHMVCLPVEAELFNSEGAVVRMPLKGSDERLPQFLVVVAALRAELRRLLQRLEHEGVLAALASR